MLDRIEAFDEYFAMSYLNPDFKNPKIAIVLYKREELPSSERDANGYTTIRMMPILGGFEYPIEYSGFLRIKMPTFFLVPNKDGVIFYNLIMNRIKSNWNCTQMTLGLEEIRII